MVENNADESRDVENIGDRSKSRIFSQGVTSEGIILLDEALHVHILERCLLSDNRSDLSELGKGDRWGG